jgi:hypothetical protein
MAATLSMLSRRGAASEEAWAKQEQERHAEVLLQRLTASPEGRARRASAPAPPRADSMLPAIAKQYLRLDPPHQASCPAPAPVLSSATDVHRPWPRPVALPLTSCV